MELSLRWMLMEGGANPPACQVDVKLQPSLPLLCLDSAHPCRLAAKQECPCVCLVAQKLAETPEAGWGCRHPQLHAATRGEGDIPSFLVSLPMNTWNNL